MGQGGGGGGDGRAHSAGIEDPEGEGRPVDRRDRRRGQLVPATPTQPVLADRAASVRTGAGGEGERKVSLHQPTQNTRAGGTQRRFGGWNGDDRIYVQKAAMDRGRGGGRGRQTTRAAGRGSTMCLCCVSMLCALRSACMHSPVGGGCVEWWVAAGGGWWWWLAVGGGGGQWWSGWWSDVEWWAVGSWKWSVVDSGGGEWWRGGDRRSMIPSGRSTTVRSPCASCPRNTFEFHRPGCFWVSWCNLTLCLRSGQCGCADVELPAHLLLQPLLHGVHRAVRPADIAVEDHAGHGGAAGAPCQVTTAHTKHKVRLHQLIRNTRAGETQRQRPAC